MPGICLASTVTPLSGSNSSRPAEGKDRSRGPDHTAQSCPPAAAGFSGGSADTSSVPFPATTKYPAKPRESDTILPAILILSRVQQQKGGVLQELST
jgi:hypothetical protein